MTTTRLEAFSDGVIAIIITIMVLELKAPHAADPAALRALVPAFLAYVLSFAFLGIYWSNHHHLLHTTQRVDGTILWANLHLLFWLSLVPLATEWMGSTWPSALPTAGYGAVMLLAAVAYTLLQRTIIARQRGEPRSRLAAAIGRDGKGKVSLALYASAIPLAFVRPWLAAAVYVTVALIWLVPDRRLEHAIAHAEPAAGD